MMDAVNFGAWGFLFCAGPRLYALSAWQWVCASYQKTWAVVDYQNDRRQSWKRRFLRRPAVEVHNEGLMQLSLLEHLRSTYGFEMLLLECQYRMLPNIAAWPCVFSGDQPQSARRSAKKKESVPGFPWPPGQLVASACPLSRSTRW